jgi:hypothetical protein
LAAYGENAITCLDAEVSYDNISQQWKSQHGEYLSAHPNAWADHMNQQAAGIKAWQPAHQQQAPQHAMYAPQNLSIPPTKEDLRMGGGFSRDSPRSPSWGGNQSPTTATMYAQQAYYDPGFQSPTGLPPGLSLDGLKPIRTHGQGMDGGE